MGAGFGDVGGATASLRFGWALAYAQGSVVVANLDEFMGDMRLELFWRQGYLVVGGRWVDMVKRWVAVGVFAWVWTIR